MMVVISPLSFPTSPSLLHYSRSLGDVIVSRSCTKGWSSSGDWIPLLSISTLKDIANKQLHSSIVTRPRRARRVWPFDELLPHWLGTVRPWYRRTALTIPSLRVRGKLGNPATLCHRRHDCSMSSQYGL